MKNSILLVLCFSILWGCQNQSIENTDVGQLAANEEVAEYLRGFEGRGALTDSTAATPAAEALKHFQLPDDLAMDLVLSEPTIHQPVEMKFDSKGRLWVVQYNQYPFPKGVKITDIDNHMRLKFDKTLLPPPTGVSGADKITFFEDTNGDGQYDSSTDAITGLNITTSVLPLEGKIWVLSPPYLLAYTDANQDGIPEGDPEVHLQGFGLEDTHAVANSLRWGPDGWIYGAQGSTTTANVSSAVSKNVAFSGQAIWRYHPVSQIFEIYGEGGGNTFNVEIDAVGHVFSGQNGYGRGPYYKQGCYYKKAWGKHGPLTNPYAFGYLPDMELEGESLRFTHAMVRYQGGKLPALYEDQFIALNALQSQIIVNKVEENGSTLKNIDMFKVVTTDDHWFRPIDIKTGPDGWVYFTDWYDSRLSHVDVRDTWSKSTGRIYRLRNKAEKVASKPVSVNLAESSNRELVQLLYHNNKWYRFAALRELQNKGDKSILPQLESILKSDTSSIYLESLWAIHLLGGFTDQLAMDGLRHKDAYVREWTVRLIGDSRQAGSTLAKALVKMAEKEINLGVRSQLAASAKRLPADVALPIIETLLLFHDDSADPDIPLMLWWALESKTISSPAQVLQLFKNRALWSRSIVRDVLLERLVQRYAMTEGEQYLLQCEQLMQAAPTQEYIPILMSGLDKGIVGKDLGTLPAALLNRVSAFRKSKGEAQWVMGIRQKDSEAIEAALKLVADKDQNIGEQLTYVQLFREIQVPEAVPVLLKVVSNAGNSTALKRAVLTTLESYPNPEIGQTIVAQYPNHLRADVDLRLTALNVLSSRREWADMLLNEIEGIHKIHREDLGLEVVKKMKLLGDADYQAQIERIWPGVKDANADEKNQRIAEIQEILAAGKGDVDRGAIVYKTNCGSCHQMFGEGGQIGPDLTGYDRRDMGYFIANIVDPNADIREGYVTYTLKTKSGQMIMGRILKRSEERVEIQSLSGEESTFTKNQIEELEPLKISLMPERLLDGMSDNEVRDLFAYIQKGI